MARSHPRDTRTLLLAVFAAFATLLLSSLATGRAAADTNPPPVAYSCQNVIYDGHKTAPPGCPTGVTVTPGITDLVVSWVPPVSDGGSPVTSYEVQYSTDTGITWITAPANPPAHANDPPATTNVVSGLTPGTGYIFQVAAVNALGVGNFSPYTEPATPTGTRASTLTVVGHNKSVVRGSSTTVRVTLVDVAEGNEPIPQESVTLRRRIGTSGTWHFVRFAQTNKEGVASVTVAPRVTTQFRWVFTSDVAYSPVASGVQTVAVRRY